MKRRTNISIEETLYDRAQLLMADRAFSDFSGFLETLIREEWERRHPAAPAAAPAVHRDKTARLRAPHKAKIPRVELAWDHPQEEKE